MAATMSSQTRFTRTGVPRTPLRVDGVAGLLTRTQSARAVQRSALSARQLVGGVLVDPAGFDAAPWQPGAGSVQSERGLGGVATRAEHRRDEVLRHPLRRGWGEPSVLRIGMAVAGLLAVVILVLVGAGVAAADADAPTRAIPPVAVVVQRGESIWTIARRYQPTGDVRPLVQSIVELHGTAAVSAGETILVPVAVVVR